MGPMVAWGHGVHGLHEVDSARVGGNGKLKWDCETPAWKQKVRSVRLLPPESMTHNEAGARVISGLPLMGCVCCAGSSVGPGHRHMA